MSGHSKWSNIKRQKETTDKQRGKAFSKLTRTITIAARDGTDPETNFKLRLAVEKARQVNMPKENINRAIQKGAGLAKDAGLAEIVYEGYGPEGVAVVVEVITDNRNRTTAEIKNIFERGEGRLTGPGAVLYLFKKAGLIKVEKGADVEKQVLSLIDLGIEDARVTEEAIEVFVSAEQLKQMPEKIKTAGYQVADVGLTMVALNPLKMPDEEKTKKVLKFRDALENHDDVQEVHLNFEI